MKAYFKNLLSGLSGVLDDKILYYHSVLEVCLLRSKPEFEPNSRTERLKQIMQNLQGINPSAEYKQNFKDYLIQYNNLKANKHKRLISWSNLYLKMFYAMQKALPEVDLLTITREQIEMQNLPCKTVKNAIDAGLLPKVNDYQRYNRNI
ncbi:MAG: hypothetical protein FJ041_03050 [Candidatus Cloacimonetes bacterium]|nr:hypothetical protein [Candidatus Cloacimonadota bacterium]